jgi:TonB-linked SusC/RagA family outer membrane protein
MKNQEVRINNRTTIDVIMEEDAINLQEVVAVGYGIQKKENLTGAVSSVKMDEVLGDRPVANAFAALQGAIPGLSISGSSSPGQVNKSINIRGTLSINGGDPLILIDNVPGYLDMVNPEDIESVTVLKDAASSAIYGARAAGGVVLITTKKPQHTTPFQVNYNNNFGFSSSINRPKQASLNDYFQAYLDAGFSNSYWSNTQDVTKWIEYLKEYKANPSAFNTIGDGIYVDEKGTPYYLHEKDIFANMLTTGYSNNHNISVTGGTEKFRYRISGGYNSDNGPLITNKDYYERMNISSFVSADMTNWFTQELDIKYAHTKQTMPQGRGNDPYTLRLINYYPEGMMPASLTLTGEEVPTFTPKNVITYANKSNTISDNPRIFSKSIFKPMKDLEIIFEYTFDKGDFNYSYYTDKWKYTTIQLGVNVDPSHDRYTRERYYNDYSSINAYGTYAKSIGNHNFKLMGGYSQESSFYERIYNQVTDQVSSVIPSLGNATGEKILDENYSEYSIRSGFYRLNYNYLNKYLFEANGRYDGSSKFPKANRFGFFPSFSAGWQFGNENFMNFSKKWLDEFKIRFSWGQIGNQAIAPYVFSPSMTINTANDVWLIGGNKVTTIGLPPLVSKTFT